MRKPMALPALVLAAALAQALAGGPARADVQPADLGTTARVHEDDGALLASQPAAADLALARDRGVRTVISLRKDAEPVGYDERAEAARLGLAFESLPYGTPEELTDAVFDRARAVLRDTPRPFLLHCGSGNRVGAVWLPWRVLDDGASLEAAVTEAREIGLASPEYEQKARDYIARRQAAP